MGKLLGKLLKRCAQLATGLDHIKDGRIHIEENPTSYGFAYGQGNWQAEWYEAIWNAEVANRKELNSWIQDFNILVRAIRAEVPEMQEITDAKELDLDPKMNENDFLPSATKHPYVRKLRKITSTLQALKFKKGIVEKTPKQLVAWAKEPKMGQRVSATFKGKTLWVTKQQRKIIEVLDKAHVNGEPSLLQAAISKRAFEKNCYFSKIFRSDKEKMNREIWEHFIVEDPEKRNYFKLNTDGV